MIPGLPPRAAQHARLLDLDLPPRAHPTGGEVDDPRARDTGTIVRAAQHALLTR